MLSAREYVEISFTRLLSKRLPTDIEVNDEDFMEMIQKLDNLITSTAKNRRIKGFYPEDIEIFLQLKVHQVLRQGKYDTKRSPYSFFKVAFDNLLRDMNQKYEVTKNKTYTDPIEDCVFFNECGHTF